MLIFSKLNNQEKKKSFWTDTCVINSVSISVFLSYKTPHDISKKLLQICLPQFSMLVSLCRKKIVYHSWKKNIYTEESGGRTLFNLYDRYGSKKLQETLPSFLNETFQIFLGWCSHYFPKNPRSLGVCHLDVTKCGSPCPSCLWWEYNQQ